MKGKKNSSRHLFMPRDEESGGILIYPCTFVRLSGYTCRYMICLANSSYSFRATALIFCMIYTHNGGVHVHRILIFVKYSQNDR